MSKSEPFNEFTILDWIGIVYIVGHIFGLFTIPRVSVTFQRMYMDFGGTLPTLTKLVIIPWFPILLGIICLGVFSMQWLKQIKVSIRRRRAVIVLSFLAASISIAVCITGIYLPIFRMAGAIG